MKTKTLYKNKEPQKENETRQKEIEHNGIEQKTRWTEEQELENWKDVLAHTLLWKHVSMTSNLSQFSEDRCRKINGGIFEIKSNFLKMVTTVFEKPYLIWRLLGRAFF